MKVELNLEKGFCKITKKKGDPYFSSGGYANAESTFLYHVKRELQKQGYDVIKKRISSDSGNLVDDYEQWIRTRNWNIENDSKVEFAIFNDKNAIYDAGLEFNREGEFTLAILQ